MNPAAVAAAVGRIPLGMRLHRPRLLIVPMHVPVLLLQHRQLARLQQRRLPRLPRRLHHHPIDWQYQTVLP